MSRGNKKLLNDFDGARIVKCLNDMKVFFNYYRDRHCNVMIPVNAEKQSILNLEDDGWESEK